MTESIQKKLLRVRPPRVRITYDVETGGALEKRELPFIVGILAELSGDVRQETPLPALKERSIKEIDRDNFNDIMKYAAPRVDLAPLLARQTLVDLHASDNAADKELVFKSLDDLDPLRVVLALPTLAAKYRARGQLRGLQSKAEANDTVSHYLDNWVGSEHEDGIDAFQQTLLRAFGGAGPAAEDRPALRAGLVVLRDALATWRAADADPAHAHAVTDDERKTAADAAAKAAKAAGDAAAAAQTARAAADAAKAELASAADDARPAAQEKADTADKAALEAEQKAGAAAAEQTRADAAVMELDTDAKGNSAIVALKQWGLLDEKFDPAAAGAAKPLASAVEYGFMLANALAAPDTPENRVRANKLLAALVMKNEPTDTSTDEERQGFRQRDEAAAKLGKDKLSMLATLAGTPDVARPANDPLWQGALLVLGLTEVDDPALVAADDFADPNAAQAAIDAADIRNRTMAFAAYMNDKDADRATIVARALPLVAALRSDGTGAATALAVQRLHYFAKHVLAGLQARQHRLLAKLKKGATAIIDEQVALIDAYLSDALSDIMHYSSFKRIEQTWRGLAYLVMNTETSEMLKLRVLNVGQDELRKDMEKAVEFDQSALFKKIYEAEYDTLGGTPYSLLVGGYEVGRSAADLSFLKKIAEVAAAAHAPFIAAASSSLFDLPGFDALDKPRDLKKIFDTDEMAGWREFRAMEDARYVSLVLPRILLRLPYGRPEKRNTIQCEGLNFEERLDDGTAAPVIGPNGDPVSYPSPSAQNFLWGNAAYALAERITHAFSLYSWTAAIRGVEGGGLVEDLPLYTYASDSGTTELVCPTEIAITDRREKELNDLGFISLCHNKGSGKAAFFGGQTTNQPKKYFSDAANANARISSMLPYILTASRFAHYIKVMMRDKIGSFLTRSNVESYLNGWIANYVLLDDNAAQEVKASYPLRAATVVVTDVPGEPGAYRATAFIKPHFQLEELTTSIRLVAELPG